MYELHCSCDGCTMHDRVHSQTVVETLAGAAAVDEALVPLVERLTSAGVTTVASCVNLREVTDALMPGASARVMHSDRRPANYRRTLATRGAFLRWLTSDAPGRAFLASIRALRGLEVLVDESVPMAHVTFPMDRLSELEALS